MFERGFGLCVGDEFVEYVREVLAVLCGEAVSVVVEDVLDRVDYSRF